MKGLIHALFIAGLSFSLHSQSLVSVDSLVKYQTIDGFGGFGPKKVWWESGPYYDAEYLDQTITNLGATIFRTQIYWDGESTNDNGDPYILNSSAFNFGPSSNNGKQFPFIKDAAAKGAKIIATVWTPPTWMKLFDDDTRIPDQCYNCASCPASDPRRQVCGGRLNPLYYEEFAEYLVAYVKTLKEQTGVELYGLSIQNEPLFANPFEANVVRPAEYADILKIAGQRFEKERLPTRFFGAEHMAEWSWGWQQQYVNESLGDPLVKPHLDIYAVHGYVDGVAPDYGSAQGWTDLYNNITVAHGKSIWMTETSDAQLQGYDLGFSMARSLYLALKFGRITAWVYWYFADAVISNNQLTPLGYAFKNFYRYVRPGVKLLKADSNDANVLALAFKNPLNGALTVILINQSADQITVALNVPINTSEFTAYRTSASENCKDLGQLVSSNVTLPGRSITTLASIGSTVDVVVGLKKNENPGLTIYPNPTNLKVLIDLGDSGVVHEVEISDITGRPVFQAMVGAVQQTLEVETANWKPGVYLLKVRCRDRDEFKKVVIR